MNLFLSPTEITAGKRESKERRAEFIIQKYTQVHKFVFWNRDTFLCNFASAQYQKKLGIQDEIEEQSFSFNSRGATKVMHYLQKNYGFLHTISRSSKVAEETNLKIDFNNLDKNVAFMDEVQNLTKC